MVVTNVTLEEEPTGGHDPATRVPIVWFFYRYERNGAKRRTPSFPTVERLRFALLHEAQEAEKSAETLRLVLHALDPEEVDA